MSIVLPALLLMGGHESATSAGFNTNIIGNLHYWASQPRIVLVYLGKLLFPASLLIDYGWDAEQSVFAGTLIALAIAAVCGSVWWRAGRISMAPFAIPWFFISLTPVLIVPLADLLAEHRLYLASLGISLLVVSMLFAVSERCLEKRSHARRAVIVVVVVLSVLLGLRTWLRNKDYADPEILWRQVVDSRPLNVRGYLGLGSACAKKGNYQEAEADLRMGVAVYRALESGFLKNASRTDYAYICSNLASILAMQNRDAEAAEFAGEARKNASEIR